MSSAQRTTLDSTRRRACWSPIAKRVIKFRVAVLGDKANALAYSGVNPAIWLIRRSAMMRPVNWLIRTASAPSRLRATPPYPVLYVGLKSKAAACSSTMSMTWLYRRFVSTKSLGDWASRPLIGPPLGPTMPCGPNKPTSPPGVPDLTRSSTSGVVEYAPRNFPPLRVLSSTDDGYT